MKKILISFGLGMVAMIAFGQSYVRQPFQQSIALPNARMVSTSQEMVDAQRQARGEEFDYSVYSVTGVGSFMALRDDMQPIQGGYAARKTTSMLEVLMQVLAQQEENALPAVSERNAEVARRTVHRPDKDRELGDLPVGDALLPLLLMAVVFAGVQVVRRKKMINSVK